MPPQFNKQAMPDGKPSVWSVTTDIGLESAIENDFFFNHSGSGLVTQQAVCINENCWYAVFVW